MQITNRTEALAYIRAWRTEIAPGTGRPVSPKRRAWHFHYAAAGQRAAAGLCGDKRPLARADYLAAAAELDAAALEDLAAALAGEIGA